MSKFLCEITETLQYQETIKAPTEKDAQDILMTRYKNQEIILDDSHFVGAEFNVVKKEKNHER
ncbi:MAG: DpnD/PcfM family protein [Bacilli bacterium]